MQDSVAQQVGHVDGNTSKNVFQLCQAKVLHDKLKEVNTRCLPRHAKNLIKEELKSLHWPSSAKDKKCKCLTAPCTVILNISRKFLKVTSR